jgi:5-methylcytosine-specific restriction endonuclease McrA
MTMPAHPALVLNADFRPMSYFPLSLLSWQDGVQAVFGDRCQWLPSTMSGRAVRRHRSGCRRWWHCARTSRQRGAWPSRASTSSCATASPADIAARCSPHLQTFEHVVPCARGGRTTWRNIVTACMPCNTRKGDALRMRPRHPPREPTPKELLAARRAFPPGYPHPSWVDYLYWDSQLVAHADTVASACRGSDRECSARQRQGRFRRSGRHPVLKTGGHRKVWRSNRQPSANTGCGRLRARPHQLTRTHRYSSDNEA